MELRDDRISELKGRPIEFMRSEQQGENRQKKKKNPASWPCGIITEKLTLVSSESQQEMRKRVGLKRVQKVIISQFVTY